jgi:hypothetical protein
VSTILAAQWSSQSSDLPDQASNLELLDTPPETPALEPRRVHVSRPLVWAVLILFGVTIVAMGLWGLGHSTLTYGMKSVDAATTGRLAQIQTKLREANAPEAALRELAIASQPGVNIGDALEALVSADKALEPMRQNAMIASARQELRDISGRLWSQQNWWLSTPASSPDVTPLPTLALPTP